MDAPVNVVGRVGAVLRAVGAHEPGGTTTTEIARITGLARPTAHRLLTSLFGQGLVDRSSSGRWLLGPELYLLGTSAAGRYDVTEVAQPVVRKLALATGESAFFSVRRGDETVCLLREDGSFPLRSHVLHEGIRFPLGVASAGLAILSYMSAAEVDAYLARTDLTVDYGDSHSAEALRQRIMTTRDAGYAVNPGLIVEGSWGMGAAVFDRGGRPRWALSLTGVERRFGMDRQPSLGRMLMDAAHHVSSRLQTADGSGWRGEESPPP